MSEARASAADCGAPARSDWTFRLFEASPLAPVWTGLLLVVAYVLLALLYHGLTGALGPGGGVRAISFGFEIVDGLLIALPLTANAWARRAALRDLRDLRPFVALDDAEMARESEAATTPPQLWLTGLSGLGVVWLALVVLFDPGIWAGGERPGFGSPALYWTLFHNVASAYAIGRMFALEAALTRGFARIAGRLRVDLLATERLSPLARKGQRSVMLWLLLSSCISVFWLGGQPALTNAFTVSLMLGVAVTAFVLPLARARGCIAAARSEELRRVNQRLGQEREALLSGTSPAPGRLADLVAWRALIEGVSGWPVTAPVLLRSALFVLLGLGSWLGGAVVDRLLDALLQR